MSARLQPLVARQYRTRLQAVRDQTNARAFAAYAQVRQAEDGRRKTVTITPAMAAEWLKHPAVTQPPLDKAQVARFEGEMTAGTWQSDPADPIQIAPNGRLLGGQHRLAALVASGMSLKMPVAFDVPPHAIASSFDAALPQMALHLEAGKGAAGSLAAAYVAQIANADIGVDVSAVSPPAAVAKSGKAIADGFRDFVVTGVLGAIAGGMTPHEAVQYGDFLTTQFTDSEVLASADETVASARQSRHYAGWEGQVSGGACATCIDLNSGMHGPDEPLYRHNNCGCEEIPIFEVVG